MDTGAFSPEELETLLEDAVLLGDGPAVAQLFERGGVIMPRAGSAEARGRAAIAGLARNLWSNGPGYLADPRQVAHSGDLALVVGSAAVNVARRQRNGSWRFVISLWVAT
jgi:ketosteroid isomerase-like protein